MIGSIFYLELSNADYLRNDIFCLLQWGLSTSDHSIRREIQLSRREWAARRNGPNRCRR